MHYWLADYRGWVEFFMSQVFTEPHSTKQREDGVAWGLETTAETLLRPAPGIAEADAATPPRLSAGRCAARCSRARRPDGIVPYETGVALARLDRRADGDDPWRRPRPDDA